MSCGWLCVAHLAPHLGMRAAWPLASHFSCHKQRYHITCTCVKTRSSQTIPKKPRSRACTPLNSSHAVPLHPEVRGNPLSLGSRAPETLVCSSSPPPRVPPFCLGPGSLGPHARRGGRQLWGGPGAAPQPGLHTRGTRPGPRPPLAARRRFTAAENRPRGSRTAPGHRAGRFLVWTLEITSVWGFFLLTWEN